MTPRQLQLVIALIDNGLNISKAARQLHCVQSAASRRLSLLEAELGVPLFDREGNRLCGTTRLCDEIVPHIKRIQQSQETILKAAEEHRLGNAGKLRVATTHAQARYFLPGVLREFREMYPQVTVVFHQGNPVQLVNLLLRKEADVAVCTEELEENEQLHTVRCYDWNHVLITPPQHPLAKGAVTLKRIAGHPILTYAPGFTGRPKIQRIFERAGLNPAIAFEAADTDVIKAYVRLGFGVGIIAGMCYERDRDGDLAMRDLSGLFPKSTTKIACLCNRYQSRFAMDFIRLVEQYRPSFGTGATTTPARAKKSQSSARTRTAKEETA